MRDFTRQEIEDAGIDIWTWEDKCGFGKFKYGKFKDCTIAWSNTNGWEHISIDGKRNTPTWEKMCEIKDLFFDPEEVVVQYHPKKSEYVNLATKCLHLWRPIESEIPCPPPVLVL